MRPKSSTLSSPETQTADYTIACASYTLKLKSLPTQSPPNPRPYTLSPTWNPLKPVQEDGGLCRALHCKRMILVPSRENLALGSIGGSSGPQTLECPCTACQVFLCELVPNRCQVRKPRKLFEYLLIEVYSF